MSPVLITTLVAVLQNRDAFCSYCCGQCCCGGGSGDPTRTHAAGASRGEVTGVALPHRGMLAAAANSTVVAGHYRRAWSSVRIAATHGTARPGAPIRRQHV